MTPLAPQHETLPDFVPDFLPMLDANELAAQRGRARLFERLSFRVDPGQALIVTGANGTGKTTLLRMLAGLSAPATGEIRWMGRSCPPFDRELRSSLVFAGHAVALKDELTAQENLAAQAELAGESTSERDLGEALDTVALGSRRALPARVLSQGQRRRIGLARLLVIKRPLWILDEPATALDSAGAAMLAKIVTAHLERGGIAVAATHAPIDLPAARIRALELS